jgi:hypothetical protein
MNGDPRESRTARESAGREEEVLIPDTRATLRPAEMVEQKLVSLLKSLPVPVSRLQEESWRRRQH